VIAPVLKMLQAAIVEAEGQDRELYQARVEIERLAKENSEQCDRIAELEQELSNARAAAAEE
jgi:predicted RNase H-like nuclease (RuvC/YqgF family)